MANIRYNPNKINDIIVGAVQHAVTDMREMAEKYGFKRIIFSEHASVYTPSVTFNDDNGENWYEEVRELDFTDKECIIVKGESCEGYLDKWYGDYFDVGHTIGRIYYAVAEICNHDDIKECEK